MTTQHQKRLALEALYRRFKEHILANESRYRLEGEAVESAMTRMSNAQFLEVEIGRVLRAGGHEKRGPTARTLMRIFGQGGFSAQTNNRTLDAVARVVGQRDFAAFVREGDFPAHAPEEASPPPTLDVREAPAPPSPEPVPPRSTSRRSSRLAPTLATFAAALLLGLVAYALVASGEESVGLGGDRVAEEAVRLVDEHNDVSLRLYRAIPDLADTTTLRASTWSDGPAYREVVRIAAGHAARGNRPIPRRLNRQLLDVEVLEVRDTVARVQTQEHWTLNFLQADSMVYKYDQTNFQLYTLRRRGERWRVWANAYAGEGEVVESNGAVPEQ